MQAETISVVIAMGQDINELNNKLATAIVAFKESYQKAVKGDDDKIPTAQGNALWQSYNWRKNNVVNIQQQLRHRCSVLEKLLDNEYIKAE